MHVVSYNADKRNIRFQLIAVLIGLVLLAIKVAAYLITNSNAILTDALESIINVLAGVFSLYSLIVASRPRDRDHPYGHGKIEFLSAGIEGVLIAAAGLAMIGKAVYNFFVEYEISQLDLGLYLIIFSGIVNYFVGFGLEKQGKKTNSHALMADGKHLKTDAYTTFGLIAGLTLIYFTKIYWLDGVAAIVFGVMIGFTGYKLIRSSVAGVMDESDEELIGKLLVDLNDKRHDEWIDVHNFRVIKYGSKLHVDAHLTLPWYYSLKEAHNEVGKFEDTIKEISKNQVELFVHSDPCVPESCPICPLSDCKERQKDFKSRIGWSLENVYHNYKHAQKE